MKVAVYTIAKNEEKFVERWYESAKEADYLLIADTGSTDNTIAKAKELGINVYSISINPWRFDDARNASLALLPEDIDYCIALDMDEVLEPGWKWQLKKAFDKGITRPSYKFIHSVDKDGNSVSVFDGFRIHTRKNIRWVYSIHEVPEAYQCTEVYGKCDLTIKHLPDHTKSRADYIPMLEAAVVEDPNNPRYLYYLGREYYYYQRYEEAADFLLLYADKSKFPAEKATAYKMLSKCEPDNEEHYLLLAVDAYPGRDSYLVLSNYYFRNKRWEECLDTATKGLAYSERDTSFISDDEMWGHMPHDLIAVSAWNLGMAELAYEHGKKAVEISPNDERLQNNLKFYQEKINGNTQ
jgi:glycosyltransferase involved in cell wall biosynthesis